MSPEQEPESEPETVSVTAQGQATIPKRFRDELGIDAPGTVQFRKTTDGQIVVEAPRQLSQFRGVLSTGSGRTATGELRKSREEDKEREADKLDSFLEE